MALRVPGDSSRSGWISLVAAVPGDEGNPLTKGNFYFRLVDYFGGTGAKPDENIGMYLSSTGMVANQQDATNIAQLTGPQIQSYLRAEGLTTSEFPIKIVDALPDPPEENTVYYVRGGGNPFITLSEVRTGTGLDDRRVNASGLNAIVRGFGVTAHVGYRHAGTTGLSTPHTPLALYGAGDDRTLGANANEWRKFVAGFRVSTSEASGEPDGIFWRDGPRLNADPNLGEAAADNLLDNTVFSLTGKWRIRCSITLDNLPERNSRLLLQMRKVVDANTSDDTVFLAHAGEISSLSVFGDHVDAETSSAGVLNRPATVTLETPWEDFAFADRWYFVWALDSPDGQSSVADFRMRGAYLQFERWGS